MLLKDAATIKVSPNNSLSLAGRQKWKMLAIKTKSFCKGSKMILGMKWQYAGYIENAKTQHTAQ